MERKIKIESVSLDAKRGLVFGRAIVCKKDGEEYYDLHGDYIPEDVMF